VFLLQAAVGMLMNRRHRHITASRPARRRAIRALPAQPPICSQLRGSSPEPPIRAIPPLAPTHLQVPPMQILAPIPSHLCRRFAEPSKFVGDHNKQKSPSRVWPAKGSDGFPLIAHPLTCGAQDSVHLRKVLVLERVVTYYAPLVIAATHARNLGNFRHKAGMLSRA